MENSSFAPSSSIELTFTRAFRKSCREVLSFIADKRKEKEKRREEKKEGEEGENLEEQREWKFLEKFISI